MDLDTALSGKPAEGASALDILRADHREVAKLFEDYAGAKDDAQTAKVLAQTIVMKIELHDAIERDVFYPALRDAAADLLGEAFEAHDEIVSVMESVRRRADKDQPVDEGIAELRKLVEEHVAFEEERLFAAAREASLALDQLGRALVKRKEELTRSTEDLEGPAT